MSRPSQILLALTLVLGAALGLTGCETVRTEAPRANPPSFTLDTPIEKICAVPAGKAVLDKDLPGLTERPEYPFFRSMSLNQLAPMSKGKIGADDLAKMKADLAALSSN